MLWIWGRYGRPGKGNDKGKVKGLMGYSRRNFMVPMQRFASWDVFNDYLKDQCRKRQADILRSHKISISEQMQADRSVHPVRRARLHSVGQWPRVLR